MKNKKLERALGNCFDGLIVGRTRSSQLFLLVSELVERKGDGNLLSVVMHVVKISN